MSQGDQGNQNWQGFQGQGQNNPFVPLEDFEKPRKIQKIGNQMNQPIVGAPLQQEWSFEQPGGALNFQQAVNSESDQNKGLAGSKGKSAAFKQAQASKEPFICFICWNKHQPGQKVVLGLPHCVHQFCQTCIAKIYRNQISSGSVSSFRCPVSVGKDACINPKFTVADAIISDLVGELFWEKVKEKRNFLLSEHLAQELMKQEEQNVQDYQNVQAKERQKAREKEILKQQEDERRKELIDAQIGSQKEEDEEEWEQLPPELLRPEKPKPPAPRRENPRPQPVEEDEPSAVIKCADCNFKHDLVKTECEQYQKWLIKDSTNQDYMESLHIKQSDQMMVLMNDASFKEVETKFKVYIERGQSRQSEAAQKDQEEEKYEDYEMEMEPVWAFSENMASASFARNSKKISSYQAFERKQIKQIEEWYQLLKKKSKGFKKQINQKHRDLFLNDTTNFLGNRYKIRMAHHAPIKHGERVSVENSVFEEVDTMNNNVYKVIRFMQPKIASNQSDDSDNSFAQDSDSDIEMSDLENDVETLTEFHVFGSEKQLDKVQMYLEMKAEIGDSSTEKVSFDGVNLCKQDIYDLKKLTASEFSGKQFTLKVNAQSKEICILGKDARPVGKLVHELFVKLKQANLPRTWQEKFQLVQEKYVVRRFRLQYQSSEFQKIKNQFNATVQKKIQYIERVQNRLLWGKYQNESKNLRNKLKRESDEKMLWHGFRGIKSRTITDGEEGFDMRFANNGAFGNGNYFAIHASYSASGGYVHTRQDGTQALFLARVLIGDPANSVDPSRNKPPLKNPANAAPVNPGNKFGGFGARRKPPLAVAGFGYINPPPVGGFNPPVAGFNPPGGLFGAPNPGPVAAANGDTTRYDSVTDGASQYVVYSNSKAYPQYYVVFQ